MTKTHPEIMSYYLENISNYPNFDMASKMIRLQQEMWTNQFLSENIVIKIQKWKDNKDNQGYL